MHPIALSIKTMMKIYISGLGADLQGSDGGALEAEIGLEVLGDFSHQALEGQLADQQLGGLLVPTDLSKSHSTRARGQREGSDVRGGEHANMINHPGNNFALNK